MLFVVMQTLPLENGCGLQFEFRGSSVQTKDAFEEGTGRRMKDEVRQKGRFPWQTEQDCFGHSRFSWRC